jgi:hypothetical protein|tara:strand:+ start:18349 stop:18594 length:246 start_codon:yes stop_codon:yes gene_type:complete
MKESAYNKLRNYVYKSGHLHGFTNEDCDDILHDALLEFYELKESVDILKLVWKNIGKHREQRHRMGKRNISMKQFEDKGDI